MCHLAGTLAVRIENQQRGRRDRAQTALVWARTLRDRPRTCRDRARTSCNRPRTSHDRARTSRDRRRRPHGRARTSRKRPRSSRDRPRTSCNRAQTSSDRARTCRDRPWTSLVWVRTSLPECCVSEAERIGSKVCPERPRRAGESPPQSASGTERKRVQRAWRGAGAPPLRSKARAERSGSEWSELGGVQGPPPLRSKARAERSESECSELGGVQGPPPLRSKVRAERSESECSELGGVQGPPPPKKRKTAAARAGTAAAMAREEARDRKRTKNNVGVGIY